MSSGAALPQVERLFREGTVSGLSETALLERFVARRDEAAFEALVARHGPLVLGVCRRMLHDPGDVEDAFQATFLVLVRKARSIRQRDALGPWLYGVAYRIARRSRKTRIRQGQRERPLPELEPASALTEPVWRDLRDVLDEELARLPERYRAPLVLCYLQGLTHDEAAARMGCPVGTVRSRLARGRERMGVRLVRRGLAPAAGLIGASLAGEAGGAGLPPALSAATVRAAARGAGGCTIAEAVSAGSGALTEGVLGTMSWKTLAKAAVGLTVVGLLVAGAFFAGRRSDTQKVESPPFDIKTPTNVRRPPLEPYRSYVVEPPDLLIIEVLEALPGRPITGEHLVRPDGTISLGFYGDVQVAGLTLPEVKEKVVLHLRTFLTDEALGLWKVVAHPEDLEHARQESKRLRESSYFKGLNPPLLLPESETPRPPPPPPPPAPASSPAEVAPDDASKPITTERDATALIVAEKPQRSVSPRNPPLQPPLGIAPPPPAAPSPAESAPEDSSKRMETERNAVGPTVAEKPQGIGSSRTRNPSPPPPPLTGPPQVGTPTPSTRHSEPDEPDQEGGGQPEESGSVLVPMYPQDTDTVFVDVAAYNSQNYYVLGMTRTPGRFPCTGRETVLDAIQNAGGLLSVAASEKIRLIRPAKGDEPDAVYPIDYAAIAYGVDPSTNYQVFPGDRIVVPPDPKRQTGAERSDGGRGRAEESQLLIQRIGELEDKLDAILKRMGQGERKAPVPRPRRKRTELWPGGASGKAATGPRDDARAPENGHL